MNVKHGRVLVLIYERQKDAASCLCTCTNALPLIVLIASRRERERKRERERERERERNVLFNDALNTFYLRLYGVRHMVKNHSDSEKGNPLPPHRLFFPINSKGSFVCTIPHTG